MQVLKERLTVHFPSRQPLSKQTRGSAVFSPEDSHYNPRAACIMLLLARLGGFF